MRSLYLSFSLTIIFVLVIMHAEAKAISEPNAIAEADPRFLNILKTIGKILLPIIPTVAEKIKEKVG
uniref:Myrmicitoxin(1)-Pr5a n=1 Tax=Pogonomyrmex rugosus TaxID=144042 RepID=TX5A_POGRU|nr:MYRTX1-Pr5a protein [Pogonomyrmex rugosus]